MWSYVQYSRIGRQVETKFKKHEPSIAIDSHHDSQEKASASDADLERPHSADRSDQENDSKNVEGKKDSKKEKNEKEEKEEKNEKDEKDDDKDDKDEKAKRDDPHQVVAAGDDEPLDPKNWPLLDRSKNIAILAFLIFVQGYAGAAESMANTKASKEFGVSKTAENLSTAMYTFGIGCGSLFAGPLSETYGRNPIYLVSTFAYMLFVLGCAMTKTFGGQVVCRFFVGLCASATLSINGGSVRDQFRPVKRAFVFPLIAWANVAAPVIAPIAGGWIVDNPKLSWQWTEWVTLIISAAAFVISFLFLPETYLPLLLEWKAKHLRRVTGDDRYVSEHAQQPSFLKRMRQVLPMPAKFFAKEPVITVLGSYLVLLYILLFSFLSGFDYIFKEPYKLSAGQTGSCFAAVAAGATAFTCLAPGLYSWARHHTEHVRGKAIEPEFRLWPGIMAAPLLPVSLFWLGWSSNPRISIWSCLGACFLFGMVLIAIYVSSYEYIIDSYGDHASIALSSITMVRYIIAGGMVMAARPMFEGIGVQWTMTFLGCIAVLLVPAPMVFYKIGHKLRKKSPYAKGSVGDS